MVFCSVEKMFLIVDTVVLFMNLILGLVHDGIYRVSGNLAEIQRLRCAVDKGIYVFSIPQLNKAVWVL